MPDAKSIFRFIGRSGRRIAITIAGGVVLLAGVVLSLPGVPGPGIILVIAGLAILGTEYEWARRALNAMKHRANRARDRFRRRRDSKRGDDA